ncbi:hypothetical protein D3C77_795390 [compost metagenome]
MGNPACPPSLGWCSKITGEQSSGLGSEAAGMNGSLRALSTSVGTEILGNQGLLDARVQ